MKPDFFIFSLPASGSSWLSVFLTGPNSYCYHEPMADWMPSEWADRVAERSENVIGGVDTASYQFAHKITEAFQDTKFFCLYRTPSEIQQSSNAKGFPWFEAFEEFERLKDLKFEPIYQNRFYDLEYLRDLWAMIIGDEFDQERAEQLAEMRITRDMDKFIANRPNIQAHVKRLTA